MEDQQTPNAAEPSSQTQADGTATTKIDWSGSGVTLTLIAINALIFLAMIIRGVPFFSPTAQDVLGWGADYGPYTLGSQWWRMFASMFLHFGIIHLAFNMLVLANIGIFMESLSGRVSYLVLYFVAGLGGNAASLFWHPTTVSAGASGAIFGLYGGLLGFLLRHRHAIPSETLKPLSKGALTFVGYNILFGLRPGVDMAAHVGGLLTGFVLGLFLVPAPSQQRTSRYSQNVVALAMGVAMVLWPLRAVPKPGDIIGEFGRMQATEDASLKLYNDSLEKWKAHQLSAGQFADTIDKQILPKWKAQRDAVANLQRLPPDQAKLTARVVQYMTAREEAWTLLMESLRENDPQKLTRSLAKTREADLLFSGSATRK